MVTARVPRQEGLHVSVSSLRLLNECPAAWRYQYMLGVQREDLPARMVLGSACHEALAGYYLRLMTGEPAPSQEELLAIATESLMKASRGPVPIWYEDDREVDGLIAEAKRILTAFINCPFVPHRVRGVEQSFDVPLVHPVTGEVLPYEERLHGLFDLVAEDEDGSIIIADHKIRRRAEPEGDFDLQMAIYENVAKLIFTPDRPIRVVHQNIIATTKTVKVEVRELHLGASDGVEAIEASAAGLEYIRLAVQHDHPERLMGRRRGWGCAGCGFRTRCAADRHCPGTP